MAANVTVPSKAGAASPSRRQFRSDFWLSVLSRALVIAVFGVIVYLMARHVSAALERQNISTGFGFLWRPARFQIGETLIAFSPADSYGRALLVALLNTLQVGIIGCLLATVVGVLAGIARLSSNPLLSRLAGVYIEIFRNTPILLQLFFWYALITMLPPVRQSIEILGSVFISQRGVQVPALQIDDPYRLLLGAGLVLGAVLVLLVRLPALRKGRRPLFLISAPLAALFAARLAGLFALALDAPELSGFGFRGGLTLSPEFLALLIGLVAYTAAFIAEIVRGGIEAIPTAQKEAAASLGLSDGQSMRLVILPQSLRIIIPPLVSEYLNLVKNSSLAVAIGYPDIVWAANTIINQTGQAIEGVLILTSVYLTLSLLTSFALNRLNARAGLASAAGVSQRRNEASERGLLKALFASPARAATSLLLIALIGWIGWGLLQWGVVNAVWSGTGQDCRAALGGACWAFLREKLRFFLFGLYPAEEHWRAALTTLVVMTLGGFSMLPRFFKPWLPALWIAGFALALWLMGGGYGLTPVPTTAWGGIPVTLLLASSALIIGFPLGIVLGVARNSNAPTARMIATGWIEMIRGVPLISILFLANTLLPLFLPGGANVDKLLRAQIALTIFASAYLAEAFRAGLRAVPPTQIEAAESLGLSRFAALRMVVLPQALQTALPGIVNTAIAIFKDTSLITIIGLFDLLGTVRAAGRDPAWLGFEIEGYVFAATVYFAFCFVMSRYGLWLETRAPNRPAAGAALADAA